MNIKYVWFWPKRQFIPLLVVDDISNEENLNLCKARECSGIVQKVAVEGEAQTKFLKYADLVFDFDDPRDVEIKINEAVIYPFMFTKSTPLDYFMCHMYSPATVFVYKKVTWYEARLISDLRMPTNWSECVFEKDYPKHWHHLKPSSNSWPIFMTQNGYFMNLNEPLYEKIVH